MCARRPSSPTARSATSSRVPGARPRCSAFEGVPLSRLNEAQRTGVMRILELYAGTMREEVAAAALAKVRDAGLDTIALRLGRQPGAGQSALFPHPWTDRAGRIRQHPERRQPRALGVDRSAGRVRPRSLEGALPGRALRPTRRRRRCTGALRHASPAMRVLPLRYPLATCYGHEAPNCDAGGECDAVVVGRLHGRRVCGPGAAQRAAEGADGDARHGRRHPRALPVRPALRRPVSGHRACRHRTAASSTQRHGAGVDRNRGAGTDRCHRADAGRHARPLVRGRHRLRQDRGDAGCALRPAVSGRPRHAQPGGGNPDRHHRRAAGVLAAQHRRGGVHLAAGAARHRLGRHVRHRGHRLSRRHPGARYAELRRGRHDDAGGRSPHPDRGADGLPVDLRPQDPGRHFPRSGGRRCWRASRVRSPRRCGFWRSPSRPPPRCARWR